MDRLSSNARLTFVNYRVLAILVALAGALSAGQRAISIPSGAKLYVSPMEWNLDRYVNAEIDKQALPVQLVSSEEQADFVMTTHYEKLGTHMLAPGHYVHVEIISERNGASVWRDEVNDFAIFFGRLRRHGPGKAAESIIKKLRAKVIGSH
jgi:hypothetical protein